MIAIWMHSDWIQAIITRAEATIYLEVWARGVAAENNGAWLFWQCLCYRRRLCGFFIRGALRSHLKSSCDTLLIAKCNVCDKRVEKSCWPVILAAPTFLGLQSASSLVSKLHLFLEMEMQILIKEIEQVSTCQSPTLKTYRIPPRLPALASHASRRTTTRCYFRSVFIHQTPFCVTLLNILCDSPFKLRRAGRLH